MLVRITGFPLIQPEGNAVRDLVIGASGAIGARLIPQLCQQGHQVTSTSRPPDMAGPQHAQGAEPAVLDAAQRGGGGT